MKTKQTTAMTPLHVRIPGELEAALNKLAQKKRRSVSELVRFALEEYLAPEKEVGA